MHRLRPVVLALALAVLVAAAVASAKPAPSAPPPSLSGEAFAGTPTITSANCNPAGQSTFTYHIIGGAFGPYPGTFEETGVVTIGPQVGAFPSGDPLVSLTADFTIDSVVGQVQGTKELVPGPNALGICIEPVHFATAINLQYEAIITTATGVFHDEGTSNLGSVGSVSPTGELGFSEGFVSTLLVPVEVKNGRGCGDKNHVHARRGECP
jgi:hypothetical protein